jgi:hypothetical protein
LQIDQDDHGWRGDTNNKYLATTFKKGPAWLLAILIFFLTESALAKSFEGKAGFTDILFVQFLDNDCDDDI